MSGKPPLRNSLRTLRESIFTKCIRSSWTSSTAIDSHVARKLGKVLERNIAFASVAYRYLYEVKDVKPPIQGIVDELIKIISLII